MVVLVSILIWWHLLTAFARVADLENLSFDNGKVASAKRASIVVCLPGESYFCQNETHYIFCQDMDINNIDIEKLNSGQTAFGCGEGRCCRAGQDTPCINCRSQLSNDNTVINDWKLKLGLIQSNANKKKQDNKKIKKIIYAESEDYVETQKRKVLMGKVFLAKRFKWNGVKKTAVDEDSGWKPSYRTCSQVKKQPVVQKISEKNMKPYHSFIAEMDSRNEYGYQSTTTLRRSPKKYRSPTSRLTTKMHKKYRSTTTQLTSKKTKRYRTTTFRLTSKKPKRYRSTTTQLTSKKTKRYRTKTTQLTSKKPKRYRTTTQLTSKKPKRYRTTTTPLTSKKPKRYRTTTTQLTSKKPKRYRTTTTQLASKIRKRYRSTTTVLTIKKRKTYRSISELILRKHKRYRTTTIALTTARPEQYRSKVIRTPTALKIAMPNPAKKNEATAMPITTSVCYKEGQLPYKPDCSKYIACHLVRGRMKVELRQCPIPLQFDIVARECLVHAKCYLTHFVSEDED